MQNPNTLETKTKLVRASLLLLVPLMLLFGVGRAPRASLQEQAKPSGVDDKLFIPDEVTRAVRDRDTSIIRVQVSNSADREAAKRMGTLVEDYGSFVVIASATAGAKDKTSNRSRLETVALETTINLPGASFEPIQNPPIETGRIDGGSGKDYYVVQFAGPVRDEWLESLRSVGAEVLQYVPHQAFFIYADDAAIQKIEHHSRVRWVGRYTAESKIDRDLRDQIEAQLRGQQGRGKIQSLETSENLTAVFDVAVFARANLEQVTTAVRDISSARVRNAIRLPHNFFNLLRVEVRLDQVERLAQLADVVRIDPYYTPTAEDERAAQIVAGNFTSSTAINAPGYNPLAQFGVDGDGVTVSVVDDGVAIPGDGGFYVTAANTVNGPMYSATAGASGHGHLNASIIAGAAPFSTLDPTGYNYGSGVAPKAHIINIPLLRSGYGPTGTEASTINDTLATSGPNGVKGFITNNSWGNGTNSNSYDSYAALYDGFVQDGSSALSIDPILIVFSAGNSGTSGLTRPKVAKNLIAVANSENLRTELFGTSANNMEDMRSTSSRGPASDGRVKPDITAPGTAISGGRSGSDALSGNIDTFHRWSTGTSHAAPQIAGAAALFTQFWKNGHGGSNPSPALAKAALLNSTQEMNGVGSASPVPNGDEGWGRINMKFLLNTGVPIKYVDQSTQFAATGDGATFTGKIADAGKRVRVSLVWTDPPGIGNPALVNDLDLTVTVGANVYRGNVFAAGNSTTGGVADNRNNVENVYLPAGIAAGTPVTIQVTATAINGNGILGNADATDQHFALVAYNFNGNKTTPFDFDGDGKTDVAVFRPSNGGWYVSQSSNGEFRSQAFGLSSDRIVPADYDGDGKTDFAVFRPSEGAWYILESFTSTFRALQFGVSTDTPAPADYDGDGKADVAVFRAGEWYLLQSSNGIVRGQFFGIGADKPVPGDYDGDGKADIAVYRPSDGTWYVSRSSNGSFFGQQFGISTDLPVVGDYDGDGKNDLAVFRQSEGNWYILESSSGGFRAQTFGLPTDLVAPGDFDGDGKTDLAVFRSGEGVWYLLQSVNGFRAQQFGTNGDRPIPGAYVQ
jgi:hypothetical protein